MMTPFRPVHLAFTLALLAVLCVVARADLTDADLAALGDKDYARRHAAMRTLLADDALSPPQVAEAYRKAESPEQRHRLVTLARHHFVRRMRLQLFNERDRLGALGLTHAAVSADQLEAGAGVRVRNTLPGFPAHARLEAGDVITAIQGQPIPPGMSRDQITTHFGNLIQAMPAGKAAEFTVLRQDKTLTLTVTLASRDALDDMYVPEGLKEPYRSSWLRFKQAMVEMKPLPKED